MISPYLLQRRGVLQQAFRFLHHLALKPDPVHTSSPAPVLSIFMAIYSQSSL